MEKTNKRLSTRDMTLCAMFTVIIAVCSWISIPLGPVPFTLQTFGVTCALLILGGMRGCISIAVYILLGAVGVPVFAGFTSGLAGAAAGYIVGFMLCGLIYWCITAKLGTGFIATLIGLLVGYIGCYAFGTVWFMVVYGRVNDPVGLWTALGWCVFPFLLPGVGKTALAYVVAKRVKALVSV